MMGLWNFYKNQVTSLAGFPPLFFRLTLAYGFYAAGTEKLKDLDAVSKWFASLGIPFPLLNTYMAVGTELAGVALLTLGLGTRIITIPLIVVMLVAIATVHYQHGFACGDNGFEIPFYYILMLFSLMITGGGKYSLDRLVADKIQRS